MIPDIFQVIHHAHPVVLPVALIQLLQSGAGVFFAFITESRVGGSQQSAIGNGAAPALLRLIWIVLPETASTGLLLPQVTNAQSTIHAARGNHSVVYR